MSSVANILPGRFLGNVSNPFRTHKMMEDKSEKLEGNTSPLSAGLQYRLAVISQTTAPGIHASTQSRSQCSYLRERKEQIMDEYVVTFR
jgi:hypothetical protein